MPSTPSAVGRAVFGGYVLGALIFGEHYPFSWYSMYASGDDRDVGAVPVFMVGGVPTDVFSYQKFSGFDLAGFAPHERCSMLFYVEEMKLWVGQRSVAGEEGPVHGELGFLVLRTLPDGSIAPGVFEAEAEGTAWPG